MAKVSIDLSGFNRKLEKLRRLQNASRKRDLELPFLAVGIYKGAKIAADEERRYIESIPRHVRNEPGGINDFERAAMLEGLGISPMRYYGDELNVRVGFDGYYEGPTGRREPIPKIVRSVSSGTTWMQEKYPVARIVTRRVKREVVEVIQREVEEQIDRMLK